MRPWFLLFIVVAIGPAAAPPAAVRDEIAVLREDCRLDGAPLVPRPGFLRRFDVNRDGRMDIVMDLARLNCGRFSSGYCGSAGCRINVFISTPRGYANVLRHTVHAVRLFTTRGETVVVVQFHGGICGRAGAERCQQRLVWRGGDFCGVPARSTPYSPGVEPAFPPCEPRRGRGPGRVSALGRLAHQPGG